jgi:hypothetical protein
MKRKPNKKGDVTKAPPKRRANVKVRAKRQAAVKTASSDPLDAMIDAGARALDLPLDPAWRAAVRFNLELAVRHALRVAEFTLPDDCEPAPVFHA